MLQSNLSKVIRNDTNLLVTLYFLLKNKQVSKTAKQLYIGQSATSHQLNRLRDVFDDQLLIRTTNGMVLTPFAEKIFPAVEKVVSDMELLLKKKEEHKHLYPMKDIYRICVPDDFYILDVSLWFYEFAERENIHDKVTFEIFNRYDLCVTDLNEGNIDFFFGCCDKLTNNICYSDYLEFDLCLAVRPGHPLANKEIDINEIIKFPWIEILFREKAGALVMEQWGSAIKNMNCALRTSSTNAAIALLRHSDAICALTEDIIRKEDLEFVLVRNNIKMTSYLYWHKIMENDSFHRYIREGMLCDFITENIKK
ncbi:LysR family transcriptional regulator [Citrobacter braakii]|uniref:LysR family transcriptional regulator n=1 Tax=Citrobacter braakii TaxID=57706 RepID=UPI00403A5345